MVKENPPQGDSEEILEVEQRLRELSVKRKNLCGAEKRRRKRALLLQAVTQGATEACQWWPRGQERGKKDLKTLLRTGRLRDKRLLRLRAPLTDTDTEIPYVYATYLSQVLEKHY